MRDRKVRWLGHWANWFDTTDGCVGVGTDEELEEIVSWVRKHRPEVEVDVRANE